MMLLNDDTFSSLKAGDTIVFELLDERTQHSAFIIEDFDDMSIKTMGLDPEFWCGGLCVSSAFQKISAILRHKAPVKRADFYVVDLGYTMKEITSDTITLIHRIENT